MVTSPTESRGLQEDQADKPFHFGLAGVPGAGMVAVVLDEPFTSEWAWRPAGQARRPLGSSLTGPGLRDSFLSPGHSSGL